MFSGENLDDSGNLILRPLLYSILIFQYTASFALSTLVPLVLTRTGLIPSFRGKFNVSPQTKCSFFCGTVVTVLPVSIFLLFIDCVLFNKLVRTLNWFTMLWLPVPLALPVLIVIDFLASLNMIVRPCKLPPRAYENRKLHAAFRCSLLISFGGSVIITLFLQLMCFHIGWLFPLLTAFPMQVGTLVFGYGCVLLAGIFITSGVVRCCISYNLSGHTKASEYNSMGILMLSTVSLAAIYYFTQGSIGDGNRDGISTTMVTLFPIIVAGAFSWLIGGYYTRQQGLGEKCEQHIQDVKNRQALSDIGEYYSKQLNDLPV